MINFTANKQQEAPAKEQAGPQLLSTLFPQTAVSDQPEVKEEQQKQKQQEEGDLIVQILKDP